MSNYLGFYQSSCSLILGIGKVFECCSVTLSIWSMTVFSLKSMLLKNKLKPSSLKLKWGCRVWSWSNIIKCQKWGKRILDGFLSLYRCVFMSADTSLLILFVCSLSCLSVIRRSVLCDFVYLPLLPVAQVYNKRIFRGTLCIPLELIYC